MSERILADFIMVVHFVWILFMIWGFVLTLRGFWKPPFFERWLFRTVHLAGILLVAALEILGKFCPLTIWENKLRRSYNPSEDYPGSFIIGLIEKLIYPSVSPLVVIIPTILMAAFTLAVFIWRPPSIFKRQKND
ncbi:MAG: DUF2784 domain-containing protein [Candidatus Zixiibacteriota bacterium]